MKKSVSAYSFEQYINKGKMKLLDVPEAAHRYGFEGIEFVDTLGKTQEERLETARALRRECEARNMTVTCYSVYAALYKPESSDAEVARLKAELDVAAELGAKIFRHDGDRDIPKTGAVRSFDAMLPLMAENCRRVTEYGQSLGIVTTVENHGRLVQDSDRMERLFTAVGHENFRLLIDIGNFSSVDDNIPLAVSRLAPYAAHVHLKDMVIYSYDHGKPADSDKYWYSRTRAFNYSRGCALGEGNVPVRQCIEILRGAGYDGFFSLEYEGEDDCLEGIQRGYDLMTSME